MARAGVRRRVTALLSGSVTVCVTHAQVAASEAAERFMPTDTRRFASVGG